MRYFQRVTGYFLGVIRDISYASFAIFPACHARYFLLVIRPACLIGGGIKSQLY